MDEPVQKATTGTLVKGTAVTTAVLLLIALQVTVFRALGDIVSSVVIFGCGYAAATLRGKR
jgi:hypothetical protein